MMKIFQYDKKTWDTGKEVSYTWQFGIIKNRALLWVNFKTPGAQYSAYGGIDILLSFFSNSLMSVNFHQRKFNLGFEFFTEYFDGWGD